MTMKSLQNKTLIFSIGITLFFVGCITKEPNIVFRSTIKKNIEIFDIQKESYKGILFKLSLENNIFRYKIMGKTTFVFESVYELPFVNKMVHTKFYNNKLIFITIIKNNLKQRKYIHKANVIQTIE